jgi:sulfhydrogenase subunit beta (sulfur reductase)
MQHASLKKENLGRLISSLAKEQKVVAPVAQGFNQYAFEEVNSSDQISLNYIPTILPPKKYFMPPEETLAAFDVAEGQDLQPLVEYEEMVLFGAHTCDLAGIQCLNMVFSEKPYDLNYLIRKNKITIIGYECNDYCDEYASCRLVHNHTPNGGYDLFFTDIGDKFIIHVNTQTGEEIVEKIGVFQDASKDDFAALEKIREKKRKIFAKNEVPIEHERIPELFDKSYGSKIWKELAEKCLACGNCTNACPSCYCFDVIDEPNLDLKTGRRYRRWDSCQNETFAKVAGGESFRKDRGSRQRHRYYRKFRYPLEKFSRFFCTGCGRCSRSCMAKINLKETLIALIKEAKMENKNAGHNSSIAEKPAKI